VTIPRAVPVLAGIAAGVLIAMAIERARPVPGRPVVRTSLALSEAHAVTGLAISPGGERIVYAADAGRRPQLFLRSLDSYEVVPIVGSEGAHEPFVSPDGRWVAFFADDRLRKAPLDGGPVQEVCGAPTTSAGGAWVSDSEIVFAPLGGAGLMAVSAEGGEPRTVTRPDVAAGEREHGWPERVPDGRILFTVSRRDRDARLALLDRERKRWGLLVPVHGAGRFVPPDHIVYTLGGELLGIRIAPDRLETVGAPVSLLRGVAGSFRGFGDLGYARLTVASSGTLAYVPGPHGDPPTRLVWVTPEGTSSPASEHVAVQQTPRLSPDGLSAAVVRRADALSREIWLYRFPAGRGAKWTSQGSDDHSPAWTADGRWLAFASNRDGSQRIYRAPVERPEAPEVVTAGAGTHVPASWSATPDALAMYEVRDGQRDISLVFSGERIVPVAETRADERSPVFSRDGRFLAYVSNATGVDEIFLAPAAAPAAARRATSSGGTEPVWGHDGSLYFRRGDEILMATPGTGAGDPLVDVRRLFERASYLRDPSSNLPNYDIARDDRFLMLEAERPREIRVILDWAVELGRRMAPPSR
jgi:serine/threonine-protein kinase